MATLYLRAGRTNDAVTQLQTALRLEPEHAPAHFNLGFALGVLGRRNEAFAAYERALAIRADDTDARLNLGGLLQAQGRLRGAAEQFRLTLESVPDDASTRFNLGLLLQMQGDANGAVTQYRLALEIAPNDADTHSSLAQMLAGQNQWEEAVATNLRALETKPTLLSAIINLAWLRAAAPEAVVRDAGQAVALAEQAADLTDRRNFIAMDVLGAAYAATGRFDDAIAAANTAIALAQAEGADAVIEAIRARLTQYLTYHPYRTPG